MPRTLTLPAVPLTVTLQLNTDINYMMSVTEEVLDDTGKIPLRSHRAVQLK